MLTLWNLFEASLLCLNAVCILHEERFMIKMGWGSNRQNQGFEDQSSVKFQILNLVRSIRTVTRRYKDAGNEFDSFTVRMKNVEPKRFERTGVPLIILNILTIIFKLLLG